MNYFYDEAEPDLLEDAILAVNNKIGIHLALSEDYYSDGMNLERKIYIQEFQRFSYEPKNKFLVQYENLGVLANDILGMSEKGILVADYVTPDMAKKLRKLNVPFIDTAGNIYLHEKGICVYSINSKPSERQLRSMKRVARKEKRIAFTPSGLKLIYALLRDSRLIKETYKTISIQANVGINVVGRIVKDLINHKYIFSEPKNRFLVNKKKLFDEWVKAYLEILRPRQCLGTFHLESDYWERNSLYTFQYYGAKLSGETACMLDKRQEPKNLDFYLPEKSWMKFVLDSRLQPFASGRIRLYRSFWCEIYERGFSPHCVNPIIIYADLISRADAESLRMARTVYEEKLQASFG